MNLKQVDIKRARQILQVRFQKEYAQRETRRRQALTAVEAKAAAVIANYPNIRAAYLFGSILRPGTFHLTSDIDIAVEGLEPEVCTPLRLDPEAALLHWSIDLRELPPEGSFSAIVRLPGKKIYERENIPAASGN